MRRFTPASTAAGLSEATAFPAPSRIAIFTSFISGFVLVQKSMMAPVGGFAPMKTSWASKSRLRAMRHMVEAARDTGQLPRTDSPAIAPYRMQEQKIIEKALAAFGGNAQKAAAALEIAPSTIYRKLQGWAQAAMS